MRKLHWSRSYWLRGLGCCCKKHLGSNWRGHSHIEGSCPIAQTFTKQLCMWWYIMTFYNLTNLINCIVKKRKKLGRCRWKVFLIMTCKYVSSYKFDSFTIWFISTIVSTHVCAHFMIIRFCISYAIVCSVVIGNVSILIASISYHNK